MMLPDLHDPVTVPEAEAARVGASSVRTLTVAAPLASNPNVTPGQVVPNLVAVKTSAAGAVAILNASSAPTQVIVDVAGHFTA